MAYRSRPLRLLPLASLVLLLAAPAPAGMGAAQQRMSVRVPARGLPALAGIPTPGDEVDVLIELRDTPAAVAWASARRSRPLAAAAQAARAQAQAIEAAQLRLLPRIAQAGGRVIYRVQRTLNGVAARLPAARLAELRSQPDVKAIRALIPKAIDNATSVGLIGAPQLWSAGVATRGEGMRIGVIDSGIDYLHADFGGSGRAADYRRNDTTVVTDDVGFPSFKVAGGYDFAGDAYDASRLDTFFPNPDPDPMDCAGHGTHVAGTIAGYGVGANGATYAGPWSATGVPTATMRIGPGVAPRATLYGLRVFGCQGTTVLTPKALDWATDPNGDFDFSDRLDVVNMSLSAPFGGGSQDPDVDAANSAAGVGVLVVASAGNTGDSFYSSGDPATADWAISVASSFDSTAITGAFRVNSPAAIAGLYAAEEAQFGPNLAATGPLTGTLGQPGGGQNNGCAPFSPANAAVLRGRIALIDRGACSFKTKIANAQAAGAVGVLVVNNVVGYPSEMADDPAVTTTIKIPAMITTQAAGSLIKAHLGDPGGVGATLTAAYRAARKNIDPALVDAISSFSARGPRRGDSALKPDITAPGDTIFSAGAGTGNRGVSLSGTSMAAPHIAGAMALLRQLHPSWSVEELKALIMNTAGVQTRTGGQSGAPFAPSRQGAGRVALPAAAAATAVAYNADNPGQVSISFGAPQVVGTTTLVKNIRVANKSAVAATYTISVSTVVASEGVTISPLSQSVTIPPFGSASFAVLMTANAALLDRTIDPATASSQGGAPRHFLNEHSGYITLRGPSTLRVPFYAAPRPASDMHAAGGLSVPLSASSAPLTLRGADVDTAAYRSRVWALELHERNPDSPYAIGLQDAGDLSYIGVGSDLGAAGFSKDTMIYFGIASFGPWSMPGPQDARLIIFVDVDRDNTLDYEIVNWNSSQAGGASDPNDVFVAITFDLRTGDIVGSHPINGLGAAAETAPYNATAMVLPVAAGELGLTAGRSRFNYYVLAFQRENPGAIDGSALHTFDPAAPALSTGGVPLLDDLDGATAQLRINRASWLRDQAQGLLLLHQLNAAPYQAEVVPVDVAFRQVFMPVVRQ